MIYIFKFLVVGVDDMSSPNTDTYSGNEILVRVWLEEAVCSTRGCNSFPQRRFMSPILFVRLYKTNAAGTVGRA
jgi:hypothetical protein